MAPINLPDGSQVSEIVLPDGSTASEVLAPDGSTVFSAIPDSAVNRWPFDEGSGTTVADSIGSNDGTLNDGNWVSGTWIGDFALEFVDSNDYVSFPTVPEIDVTQDFGFSITLETPDVTQSGGSGSVLEHTNNGQFRMTVTSEEIRADMDGNDPKSTSINNDTKYRLFFIWDSTNTESNLYVNDSEATGTNGPTSSGTTGFRLAEFTSGDNDLSGILDEPMVYGPTVNRQTVTDDHNRQPWS